jgi:hypothetical protein
VTLLPPLLARSPQVQLGGTPINGSLSDFLPDAVFSVEVHQVEISLRNPSRSVSFGVESVIITLELQLFSTVFMTTLTVFLEGK